MVNKILDASGLEYRRGRFVTPPAGSYVVYLDDQTTDGPDGQPWGVVRHDVILELYEPYPDDEAETSVETAISTAGLQYTKQDRYWLQSEQLYQVIYEFTYYEKRRA